MKRLYILSFVALISIVGQDVLAQQAGQPNQEQLRRDQLKIGVQEICPITGNKLGTHGTPIKVKVGEETIFLCCKGCLQQKVKPEHWATIHANFAKAQGICPVMKKDLPKNAKWTIVEGQIFYVCCPPCTDKIKADPKVFLRQLDDLYAASLKKKLAAN